MDDSTDERSNSKRTPLLPGFQLKEPDPDLSLAMPLEEQQQGDSSPFPTIESESKDDDDDGDDDYEFNTEDYEFFSSWGIDEDFGLLGSSSYFMMEEDDDDDEVDPDDLSYEQLVELGEIIGEAKRGLSTEQISSCLHPFLYKPVGPSAGIDRCIICQVEYHEGEALAALACNHPYHPECIRRWLHAKKSCPICKAEVSTI